MKIYNDVLAIWAHGTCYAKHDAKALYVVIGDGEILPACGDHLTRAIREVARSKRLVKVDVWIRP